MSTLTTVLAFVFVLGVLVFVHELGHFLAAKRVGIRVLKFQLGFNPTTYINNTWDFVQPLDVISGLVKAAVFGFIVTLMGCYNGYHSRGGAQGVGAATTYAVVSASILILVFDYVLTEAFFAR